MGNRRKLSIIVDAEYEGEREIQQADNDINDLGSSSEKSGMSLSRMAEAGAAAGIALGGVAAVAKVTYETLNEGAEIQVTADKFDALAGSIGANSAFMEELTLATKGTRTQFELQNGASELMGLGFVKNQEQAVRLTAAVGALDMDMTALGLTIANETTARFDTLGVSTEGWKKTLEETQAAGGSFTDALIVQSERQIAIVGNAADSMVGDMQRIQVAQENIVNRAKQKFAGQWAPIIGGISDLMQALENSQGDLDTALENGLITVDEHAESSRRLFWTWQDTTGVLEEASAAVDRLTEAEAIQAQIEDGRLEHMASYNQLMLDSALAIDEAATASNIYVQAGLAMAESSREAAAAGDEHLTKLEAIDAELGAIADAPKDFIVNLQTVGLSTLEQAKRVLQEIQGLTGGGYGGNDQPDPYSTRSDTAPGLGGGDQYDRGNDRANAQASVVTTHVSQAIAE